MARQAKKNVYDKIKEKMDEIKTTENTLERLHKELDELNNEKNELEMRQLFEVMKSNGLTIDKATELLKSTK